MRELLLLPLVVGIVLAGVAQPRIGICGYIWFSLMRPDLMAFAPNRPYSQALALSTLIGSLRFLPQIFSIFKSPIIWGLLALQALIAASVFTAVVPSYSYQPWLLYLKMLLLIVLIPVLIQTREWISIMIQVMAFSLGFLALKYGIFSVLSGGARIAQGVEGTLLADNNTLAMAFVCGVSLCWFARDMTTFRPFRLMYTAMAVFAIPAVVSTYSRGAAVTLVIVGLWIGMRSKHKVAVGAIFVLFAMGAVLLVGEAYIDRLATLKAPTDEQSASHRLEYAFAAVRMWADYPVLGVGFGMTNQSWLLKNYTSYAPRQGPGQVIHNTYLQMLTDSGFFALLVYVGLIGGTLWRLGRSIKSHQRRQTGHEVYPMALQMTLLAISIGNIFMSRVHFDLVYMLLMTAASWDIYEKNAAATQVIPWSPPQPAHMAGRVAVPAMRAAGANGSPTVPAPTINRINHI